jgi:hypothetical protein
MPSGIINDRIAEPPTYACGIRPEHWIYILRYLAFYRLEVFEDPAPRPVDVSAFIEYDVDEGAAEKRKPPHDLHLRCCEQCRAYGICDLIFHEVRTPAGPFRVNDYLCVAQVRYGIERRVL